MRDLKGFARAQSIFIELVVKDVNLSSVPVNPVPSDKSPPESAIIPPLGLKVADQRVSGDFEVGYVRESKPIVMLDPRSYRFTVPTTPIPSNLTTLVSSP